MYFTQIPDVILSKQNVPIDLKQVQSSVSTKLSSIVTYVSKNFQSSPKYRKKVIDLMNTISYYVITQDSAIEEWDELNPFETISIIDSIDCKEIVKDFFILQNEVQWDDIENINETSANNLSKTVFKHNSVPKKIIAAKSLGRADLSFKFPAYPSIDTTKIWKIAKDDADRPIPIYCTVPEIPETQNQISITTDISKMCTEDLLNLFPSSIIHTRYIGMYEKIDGFSYDDVLGYIPKISGFTESQIKSNIIKYPQFNYMYRIVDGKQIQFTKHIEIDGNLMPLKEAIYAVSDMKRLPKNKYFIWEYIIRRYLLERDIKHIQHKYPLVGSFDPYMTLFMPAEEYKKQHLNPENLAKKCVEGRIKFYTTRNPLLRRCMQIDHCSS